MGKLGRPPKPTALKELEGNPGKRKVNILEVKPEKFTDAPPPRHFDSDERKMWFRYVEMLDRIGLFTEADYDSLARFVELTMTWRRSSYTDPETGKVWRLSLSERLSVHNALCKLENYFGLNPSARSGMVASVTTPLEEQDPYSYD